MRLLQLCCRSFRRRGWSAVNCCSSSRLAPAFTPLPFVLLVLEPGSFLQHKQASAQ
jgi:hypothetical protein